MKKRIAINGFGRIGRLCFRNLMETEGVEIVAINDLTDLATLAYLLRYDSLHGKVKFEVSIEGNCLMVNNHQIPVYSVPNPEELPWSFLEVDVLLECTGRFTTEEDLLKHIQAGAKKVILSAPAKSPTIPTIVRGVNDELLKENHQIVSNASCTTNCLAPIVKIIDENWGLKSGFMSTIHAYTANQNLQDGPHKDLRRARAAAVNIIPTSTGAAKALAKVLPSMEGKISASCLRVPIPTGSLIELTCVLDKAVDKSLVNQVFSQLSNTRLKGIMAYTDDPIVLSDIVTTPYSCIIDASLTEVHHGMLKITAWYDNESGYATRLAELATMMKIESTLSPDLNMMA